MAAPVKEFRRCSENTRNLVFSALAFEYCVFSVAFSLLVVLIVAWTLGEPAGLLAFFLLLASTSFISSVCL